MGKIVLGDLSDGTLRPVAICNENAVGRCITNNIHFAMLNRPLQVAALSELDFISKCSSIEN